MFLLLALTFAADPYALPDDFKAAKPADLVDAKSKDAPEGATILFDGKSFDAWIGQNGKPVTWTIVDGAMQGKNGSIVTKEKFDGSFTLHVEFRVPYEPDNKGQGRGNSGIYLQGRYEVQVLDSYGLKSSDTDCASIYTVSAPSKNVCKAPTIWQSYDIEFQAPKFENGKKAEPVHMTVYHNGVKVQDNVAVKIDNTRAGMGGDPSMPGPIMLQDHGHPVQYRNIWLKK